RFYSDRVALIFCVIHTGNPGVVGFYRTFMQTLYSMFGCCHPVWAVSHAGHCEPPHSMDMVEGLQPSENSAKRDVFGLNGQIEHKLAFIRRHVPRETSLVLVGHSIGCYIILDIMKRNPKLKIIKAVLLFPTIERMAETPQGKVMTPVLCHMRYLAYLPVFLLSLLPAALQEGLIRLGVQQHPLAEKMNRCDLFLFVVNAMYMGGQEMRTVMERDNITIEKNIDKLLFYYGASDHWCPVQYYHDIKQDFPRGNFRLCENRFLSHQWYIILMFPVICPVHYPAVWSLRPRPDPPDPRQHISYLTAVAHGVSQFPVTSTIEQHLE
uniref:Lipid droplet-associated hydrolase n=1 Tax=Gasterosteus aculeatus aculeatus TaxID=481459 RepID=G3PJ94_GASAC